MVSKKQGYDYIIAGAGCAGLSLLMHMIRSGQFREKKILLIEKEQKNKNDRTWCFWETEPGIFEPIVYRQWQQAWFHGEEFSRLLELSPNSYKLIKGIDFYDHCLSAISQQSNIEILTGEVQEIVSNKTETAVMVDGRKLTANFIFNSILFEKPQLDKNEYRLLQHFKGWVIDTPQGIFNPAEATLMDFRVSQQAGAAFVYVMPFSSTKVLVEYTLFTDRLLEQDQYEDGLRKYIAQYIFRGPYKIAEEEFGIIPMTNYKFPIRQHNIINIGTAGGQTKASSGYTFKFIQKNSAAIVDRLIRTGDPFINPPSGTKRFHFYDSVLLNILYHKNELCRPIFTDLFMKNKPRQILKFLDNESTLKEELKIISTLPTLPFLKAAFKQL